MKRLSKIGCLSENIRNELNRRIRQSEFGTRLVDWLSRLPEVQTILARDFGGRPINTVNLVTWKAGGYCRWRFEQKKKKAHELFAALPEGKLANHQQINPSAAKLTQVANQNQGDADQFFIQR